MQPQSCYEGPLEHGAMLSPRPLITLTHPTGTNYWIHSTGRVVGEVTWKTLDIWIPAVRFTGIIGTQLRGRSTKSVLVDKMALDNSPSKAHHQKHNLKRALSGSAQEGRRITGISSLKNSSRWTIIWGVPWDVDKRITHTSSWYSWPHILRLIHCAIVHRFTGLLSSKRTHLAQAGMCSKMYHEQAILQNQPFKYQSICEEEAFIESW